MGRCGGPVTPLLLLLVWGAALGAGVGAARLPSLASGRLAPGPSVEDDHPLPGQHAGHQGAHRGGFQQPQPQQRRCTALPTRVLRQVLGPAYNPSYMAFSLDEPGAGRHGGFGPFQDDDMDQQHSSRVLKESPWTPTESLSPFSVDEDFREVLSEEPAWQVRYDMQTVMLNGDSLSYRTSAGRRHISAASDREEEVDSGEVGAGRAGPSERTARAAPPRPENEKDEELDQGGARSQRAAWGGLPYGKDMQYMQWHCESPLRWLDLGPDYFPRYLRSADCGHHTCSSERFVCKPRSFTVKVLRRREGMCAPAGDSDSHVEESSIGLPHDLRDLWVWELRAVNFCCVCSVRM